MFGRYSPSTSYLRSLQVSTEHRDDSRAIIFPMPFSCADILGIQDGRTFAWANASTWVSYGHGSYVNKTKKHARLYLNPFFCSMESSVVYSACILAYIKFPRPSPYRVRLIPLLECSPENIHILHR